MTHDLDNELFSLWIYLHWREKSEVTTCHPYWRESARTIWYRNKWSCYDDHCWVLAWSWKLTGIYGRTCSVAGDRSKICDLVLLAFISICWLHSVRKLPGNTTSFTLLSMLLSNLSIIVIVIRSTLAWILLPEENTMYYSSSVPGPLILWRSIPAAQICCRKLFINTKYKL